ncbi:unnamed protein product [Mytilus coruscus]|uniref:RNase H type-1 domain-containing protein n=1 Tax=Mytilus coruscus TaxID=42192 RepID=A0A6J8EYD2_MYTCO|nr:unnamed protein product [Mytilus coruscus]
MWQTSGIWPKSYQPKHINWLELKAVQLALQEAVQMVKDKNILIRSDNTIVISYINKQGGTYSPELCYLLNLGPLPMVYSEQCKYPCSSHSGKDKSTSRCSFEGGKSFQDDRVDTQHYDESRNIESCGMEMIKLRHKSKGFSEKIAEIMANARKTSTQTVHDARLRIYDSWCKEHNYTRSSRIFVISFYCKKMQTTDY